MCHLQPNQWVFLACEAYTSAHGKYTTTINIDTMRARLSINGARGISGTGMTHAIVITTKHTNLPGFLLFLALNPCMSYSLLPMVDQLFLECRF